MQSKLGGDSKTRNFARAFFVFGLMISLIFSGRCPQANAAGINLKGLSGWGETAEGGKDYTASYLQSFYSAAAKNAANTTGSWVTDYGYLSLKPSSTAALSTHSYKVEDRSSVLANFIGPVSLLMNDDSVPVVGNKAGSLLFPIDSVIAGASAIDISGRLVGFSSFDIKALGASISGDADKYSVKTETSTDSDDETIYLGNEQAFMYFLIGGDNAQRSSGTKSSKLNRIKVVSLSDKGVLVTQTEDVSSGLSALGFEAISDISCSEKECLIAGTKGKLASYNGKTFTDLSGNLDSDINDLELGYSESYFLIAGNEHPSSSSKYIGRIYKYQSGSVTKISDDSSFVSDVPGAFALSLDSSSGEWLILKGGDNVLAYIYSSEGFKDVSAKIGKSFPFGSMTPGVYRYNGAWFIIDEGVIGPVLRFDGESVTDIGNSLGINVPIYAIGSDSDSSMLLGGGTSSSPKLYKVTESAYATPSAYESGGVVESIKVNKTTGTITSAYIRCNDYTPAGTDLAYYLSADGGSHWTQMAVDDNGLSPKMTFQNPGSDLRWRVTMSTNDVDRTPAVYSLGIYYNDSPEIAVPAKPTTPDNPSAPVADMKNGDFVRAANDSKVYAIMGSKKRQLAAEELLNIKHYFVTIKIVAADVLGRMPEVKLAKVRGGSALYYLTGSGMKKLILSDAVFKSYGNKYEDVVEMEDYHLDLYPTVRFIKGTDAKVYQIKGATKEWVATPQEFQRLGGSWSEIASVNDIELAAYQEVKTGVPQVQIVDGDILRASDNMDVYIVKIVGDKKFKRLVLTPTVFSSYGHLKWENLKVVDSAVLDGFMTSEFVTMCSKAKVDADCDIYFLHDVYDFADSGYKELMAKADFVSGRYDLDSVYVINNADFQAYRDSVVWGEGTRQVQHVELLASLLGLFKNRYGMDFRLDKNKFTAIMEKVVIKERESTTTGMRADFQKLLAESGMGAAQKADLKYLMTQGAIYEKYFLDDAIASFDAGKAVESAQRKALKQEITAKYPLMADDFALLEIGLGQVAQGKFVRINGTTTYFDKDGTGVMREIYDENLTLRFGQLF